MFRSQSLEITPSITFSKHYDPKKSDWVIVQTNIKIEEKKPVTLDSGTMGGMERFLISPTPSATEKEKKLTEPHHLTFVLDVSSSMTSPSYPIVRIPDLEGPTQKSGYEIVYLSPSQDIDKMEIKPNTFYIKIEKEFFAYAVVPPSDKKPIIATLYAGDIGVFRDLTTLKNKDAYQWQKYINKKLDLYSKALKHPFLAPQLLFEYATERKHIRAVRQYPKPVKFDNGYLYIWVPEYIKMSDIVPQKYTVYVQPLPEKQAFEFCVLSSLGKQIDIISFDEFKKSIAATGAYSVFEELLTKEGDSHKNKWLMFELSKIKKLKQHMPALDESSLIVMKETLIKWIEKQPSHHRYSLIVFASEGELLLQDGDQSEMLKALRKIESSMGTNVYAGLSLMTKDMMKSNTTIFLMTDGASSGPGPAEIIQKLKIALDYSTTFPMVIIGYGKSYDHQWLAALEKGSCYPHVHLGHSGEMREFFEQNKLSAYLKPYFPTQIELTFGGHYIQYRENNILPWQGTYAFPVGDILSRDSKREFTYALQVTVNGQSVTLKGRSALPSPKPEIINQFLIAESHAIFHETRESRQNQILQLQKLLLLVDSENTAFELLQQLLFLYQPLEDDPFGKNAQEAKNEKEEKMKQMSAQLSRYTMTGDGAINKSLKRTKGYDPKEHILILSEIPYLVINSRFDFADQKLKNNLVCVAPGLTSRNAITIPFDFIDKLQEQPDLVEFFKQFKNQTEKNFDSQLFLRLRNKIKAFGRASEHKECEVGSAVSLEDYFKKYNPLRESLPQALLMALLMGELVKSHHLLPGKVNYIERMAYNFNKLDFVIYETAKQVFYIDPSNALFFDLKNDEELYQLFDILNRDYPGFLMGLAQRYNLEIPVKLEKIDQAAYDIFSKVYSGPVPPDLCCAKTKKLMQHPVLLVQDEDYACFEARSLYSHLREHKTHPLTEKKLDLQRVEIYPAFTKTKQIWDWMQEKIRFFPESAIAAMVNKELSKTLSKDSLEDYFQVKFCYDSFKKKLVLSFPFKEQAAYFMTLLFKEGRIHGIRLDKDNLSAILFTPVMTDEQSAYFDFKLHSALLLFLQLLNLNPIKAFIKTKLHQKEQFSLVGHCYLSPEIYTLDALSASAEAPKDESRDLFYQRTKLYFTTDDNDFNLGKYRFYIPGLRPVSVLPKEYSRTLQEEAPKPQTFSLATSTFLKEIKQAEKRLEATKDPEQRFVKSLG